LQVKALSGFEPLSALGARIYINVKRKNQFKNIESPFDDFEMNICG